MLDDDVLRWRAAGRDRAELFRQLAQVRLIIEPAAAALAAQCADQHDLDALAATLEDMQAASDAPDSSHAAEADVAFHAMLLRSTHNELLSAMRIVIEHGLRQRDLIVHAHPHAADPIPAHRAVLDAIARRDPDGAAQAMLALLNQSAIDFEELENPKSARRRKNGKART